MESDCGKIFVGGISWETTEEKLKEYFGRFGEVVEAVIMKDRTTGRARGFGFVVFSDPHVADIVALDKHTIHGRLVEAKKAVPKEEQHSISRGSNGSPIGAANQAIRTKKIFVGGLASSITESEFRKYFEQYGTIVDAVVMYDHGTQRPRGFGFITYDSEDAVDRVLQKTFHDLSGKTVEVKRAVPKELSSGPSRSNVSGYGQGGLSSRPIGGVYATTIDSRLLSPSPSGRGGYPPFGTVTGFGTSRAFENSSNGVLTGGFGGNVSDDSGYGGASSGYFTSGLGNIGYANNTPGKNIWGGGVYPTSGTSWGSSQNHPSSNTGFGMGSYNYGMDNSGFRSNPTRYAGENIGFGSSAEGSFGSGAGSLVNQGYNMDSGYADMQTSSVFRDSVWKMSEAETFNSRMGAGSYFLSGIAGSNATSGAQTGYGGFNATGRQAP